MTIEDLPTEPRAAQQPGAGSGSRAEASTSPAEAGTDRVPMGLGIFLLSVAVLALQVLQTRILSVQMWHHHGYMVVTMTLLGFGAAGSVVTVWPALARGAIGRRLAWCGSLFAVSVIVGYLVLSKTADHAASMTASGDYVALSVFYSYLLVPYFFAGLVVTIILTAAKSVHRLYFANLLGSAVGAWVFMAVITPLGAERLLVLCAATGPLASLSFLRPIKGEAFDRQNRFALGGALASLLACALLFLSAQSWLEVRVASSKAQRDIFERVEGAELLEVQWTPLCRLDFVELPHPEEGKKGLIDIYQDGDAITVMHTDDSWELVPPIDLNTAAYVPHELRGRRPDTLVIGVGGGIDIRYALDHGAQTVTGIEINPVTVAKMYGDYAEFNDGVYSRPGVEVLVGEGRHTLSRLDKKFDVIQLSGTDTYTAGNSGAYVLSESFLYTSNAVREYFAHLEPEGTLGMIRVAHDPPRENLRLFATALIELRNLGIEKPSQHAAVIRHANIIEGIEKPVLFSGNLYSMTPLTEGDVEYLKAVELVPGFTPVYLPGMEGEEATEFSELARLIDEGREEEFYASYPFDVRPVDDDSPFFFHFHHWDDVLGSVETTQWQDYLGGPIGLKILGSLLVQTTVLTALLVVLPLLLLRREGLETQNKGRVLTYFLALGMGFMFLEISTVQRLVLYLGHPTYSLTVTLFCFLFFAGLGSAFASRFQLDPARSLRRIGAGIVLGIVLLGVALEVVPQATLGLPLPARIGVAVAMLAPINFLMGMPFPVGLARLRNLEPRLVPWALGANGSASVIGSILCIVLAMESGFRVVSLCAAATYAVGVLVFTTGRLAPGRA